MPFAGPGRPFPTTALRVPVRFELASALVDCATRELSIEGAFVCCSTPPRVGTSLVLQLALPDGPPEELLSRVRAVIASGPPETIGFWADFAPGREEAQARIAQLLSRVAEERGEAPQGIAQRLSTPAMVARLTPAMVPRLTAAQGLPALSPVEPPAALVVALPDGERRKEPRFSGDGPVPVRFRTVEEFVLEYAANISAGGVFIETVEPPQLGTRLRVRLDLPDGGPPAEVSGVVVHRLEPREAGARRRPGAGVQFSAIEPAFAARIERFLDWALARRPPRPG